MIYPKIPLAQSIIQICEAKGIHTIIISPGSRNAPLTIGFASNLLLQAIVLLMSDLLLFLPLVLRNKLKNLLRWFVPLVQHFELLSCFLHFTVKFNDCYLRTDLKVKLILVTDKQFAKKMFLKIIRF
jgi:hypothetical protein